MNHRLKLQQKKKITRKEPALKALQSCTWHQVGIVGSWQEAVRNYTEDQFFVVGCLAELQWVKKQQKRKNTHFYSFPFSPLHFLAKSSTGWVGAYSFFCWTREVFWGAVWGACENTQQYSIFLLGCAFGIFPFEAKMGNLWLLLLVGENNNKGIRWNWGWFGDGESDKIIS